MNRKWYYTTLAIILFSLVIRQPLLLLLGILALLVLASIDIWANYCMRNLRYQRELSARRVLFGEAFTFSITLENAKLLPLPWLEIEESISRSLVFADHNARVRQSSASFVMESLFSLRWYERLTRRYTVTCAQRGVHTIGPTTLRSGDVFGFLNRQETIEEREYLMVYPMVVPLTRFSLPARHPFGDYNAPRRLLEDPSRVIGVREYQYGDEMRRVHWKATARAMQLQSKVYQPTTTYTMVIFLNLMQHLDVWYGIHPELQELAICAAASVANWALDEGLAVGLYANTMMYMPEFGMKLPKLPAPGSEPGDDEVSVESIVAEQLQRRRIHLPPASSEDQRRRIMETLARIQTYFGSPLEDMIQVERTRLPAGATVVVITAVISEPLLDILSRVRSSGHAVTLIFVGDIPMSKQLAGITVYHIGGEDTWKQFMQDYTAPLEENSPRQLTGTLNL
ncbi:MAG TPA: DUF58 domain-containing protein [Ktedonobacteraceae bacterium]|nr:DUF58 domain-containing protein [Ktedonobacteraceae bacterium]